MDGVSLVEAIRSSTSLRELPVILVTARENESDRQRGLDAGADAYIVKSSFRQEELLDAIGALT
jgi:two-component system chemotaxis sensor kinase CheA